MIRYVIALEWRVGRSTIVDVIRWVEGRRHHVMVIVWSCWMAGSSPLSSWHWCARAGVVVVVSPLAFAMGVSSLSRGWVEGWSPPSSWHWHACAGVVVVIVVLPWASRRLHAGVDMLPARCDCLHRSGVDAPPPSPLSSSPCHSGICHACLIVIVFVVVVAAPSTLVFVVIVVVLACTHCCCCHHLAVAFAISVSMLSSSSCSHGHAAVIVVDLAWTRCCRRHHRHPGGRDGHDAGGHAGGRGHGCAVDTGCCCHPCGHGCVVNRATTRGMWTKKDW